MPVSLIAAVAANGVIGRDGGLPWHLPADLARFKRLTSGHHLIVGRATWESIGRPLPDRTFVVVTRSPGEPTRGLAFASSVEEGLEIALRAGDAEPFVAGGEGIFREALERDLVDRLYLTLVAGDHEGDARFPAFDESRWQIVAREALAADAQAGRPAFEFVDYARRSPREPLASTPAVSGSRGQDPTKRPKGVVVRDSDGKQEKLGLGTLAVWAGEEGLSWEGSTQVPVALGVTFGYDDLASWTRVARGEAPGHIYGRSSNPTTAVFEEKIRILEGAEAAISFASGMAAVSNLFFALLSPGDRVISIRDTYGGTSKLFLETLPRFGVEVVLCETSDHDALEAAISAGCRLVYLETPTNPTLKVLDLQRLAAAAAAVGAVVAVDNTFATPINQRPLELGADLVIHSATKFLGGHSDAMGGVLCGDRETVSRVFSFREVNGAVLQPMAAYLLLRGMKTLELRVARQNENGLAVARFLRDQPKIERVFYPGLEDDPGHAVARRQMRGFGGLLSFSLRGGMPAVTKLLDSLRFAHLAASLGSVATLAGPPSTTSHVEISAEQRAELGIPEGLVRYSVGIENVDDLVRDLERALAAV